MSTSSVLKEAWAAVEEAGLPERIHEAAFREAVRLISPATTGSSSGGSSGGSSGARASNTSAGASAVGTPGEGAITIDEDELLRRVATGTGADLSALSNLIYVDDGELRLILPGIKLGKNNADRTRTIAALFTVVRSFGLNEDDTSVELVRDEAQRLKCYDSANFASQLKALQGFVIKGTGANRRIQAKGPALSEFPALVAKLAGEA